MSHDSILSDARLKQLDELEDLFDKFAVLLHTMGGTDPAGERFGSRNLSLSYTHLEDAVNRAQLHAVQETFR